jgi:3-phosphoshikimate 1-carboxyvinyltransferase
MMLEVQPAPGSLRGALTPPGDKSISHRALILGGLASGATRIHGLLDSADTRATRHAMEQLGAEIVDEDGAVCVRGVGAGSSRSSLRPPAGPIDMGNSGTALRLLAGVLAAQPFDSQLTGDASLCRRPMARIMRPLEAMGARIDAQSGGRPPLRIHGGRSLRGIEFASPVASAQVKSCVLLAGLFADGRTRVTEPRRSRDHTERMLPAFGIDILADGSLVGPQCLRGTTLEVPADPSSAAFHVAAALLVPDSDVTLRGVGLNPTRIELFEVLRSMGAKLDVKRRESPGLEPVGDLHVRYSGRLRAAEVAGDQVPAMIDEIPVLLAVAACAEGTTRIRDAEELRVKESDRLAVMARGLARMGIEVQERADGIDVTGGRPVAAAVDAANDHRCAMSFAVLAQRCEDPTRIAGAGYIDTSYPGFAAHFRALGAVLESVPEGS